MVTARRSGGLQNVPGQVTRITAAISPGSRAQLRGLRSVRAGLSYQIGQPGHQPDCHRGITTGGSQLNSAIGLYLDDIPFGASTSFGLGYQSYDINVFDLDRVECSMARRARSMARVLWVVR